ncbi:MAG: mannosyl-3-phosphoglycerate synthase [Chloroflexi bacterium]|nr:mannosyl-3-phosphoglycerate synthase [Chloroflexota bacterium]MBP8054616.1 mannosyl-3-phosphoglycerate synthase [Chloroflexota bacterium]
MRIAIPQDTERFGAVLIHSVQHVWELDASLKQKKDIRNDSDIIRRISYEELNDIEQQMAIVVPMRGERIKLVEGVLCGIPNHCLVIIASNSPRHPVDRFAMEREAFARFSKFTDKQIIVVHQQDKAIAEAFRRSGYEDILDPHTGLVRNGKAEGMIMATMLACLAGRKYIGFVDADNYFPGAVLEYVHEYAAGFVLSQSRYIMTRIAWHSKPKIVEDALFFAKWGRTSRSTNRLLNNLLAEYTGFETEIIKTGNAGEHALTMDLAMQLRYSSGYSIEPYHFINLFEQFGGIQGTTLRKQLIQEHVEIFQIASRNPHMHDSDKGDEHINDMTYAAMQVIYHSPICPQKLKKELLEKMQELKLLEKGDQPANVIYYPPLWQLNLEAFYSTLSDRRYAAMLVPPEKYKSLPGIAPALPADG